jgi:hypothetical protein
VSSEALRRTGAGERIVAVCKALCLIGFPAIPMFIYLSGVHPALPGATSAEQIKQMAGQAMRWSQVHLGFSVAGFLALGVLFTLRGIVASRAPVLLVEAATVVGVIGGFIFTGTVLMEVNVVPDLASACARTPICVTSSNSSFTNELADQGWRVLPGLRTGGRTLMVGIAALAMIGFTTEALKPFEAAPIFMGSVLEAGLNTGLHSWGNFQLVRGFPGLAAVGLLIGGGLLAVRLVRQAWRPSPVDEGPAAPKEPALAQGPASEQPALVQGPALEQPADVLAPGDPEEPLPAS